MLTAARGIDNIDNFRKSFESFEVYNEFEEADWYGEWRVGGDDKRHHVVRELPEEQPEGTSPSEKIHQNGWCHRPSPRKTRNVTVR